MDLKMWPEKLIEELAYRRCILFIGSGISATAKNSEGESPKTWGELLKAAKIKYEDRISEENLLFIQEMMEVKNYLMAVQAIQDSIGKSEFIYFLKNELSRKGFQASSIHELIRDIDSKIVITTNFDKIYDSICDQQYYLVFDYEDTKGIIEGIKSPEYVIIKAHGSIDRSESIIFTAEQYYKAQTKYSNFYQLLSALFLTHTVVFLGYSLQDPDINLVLQFISAYTNNSSPHYLVCTEGTPIPLKRHWQESYNVSLIEYGKAYGELEEAIKILKSCVFEMRESRGIS